MTVDLWRFVNEDEATQEERPTVVRHDRDELSVLHISERSLIALERIIHEDVVIWSLENNGILASRKTQSESWSIPQSYSLVAS